MVLRRWRDLPFAHKLALLLFALVNVPIVIAAVYTTYAGREALLASMRARTLERARGTAEVIDAFIADKRSDIRTASSLPSLVDLCRGGGDAARGEALRALRVVRDEQQFLALHATDRAGRVIVATDARVRLGSYQTGRAFLGAIAGEGSIDEPQYEPFDNRVAIRVSHAVRAETGDVLGTVTGLIDVSALDALIRRDANYRGLEEFSVLWTGAGLRLSDSRGPSLRFTTWAPLPPETAVVTARRLGPAYPDVHPIDDAFAPVADRGAWLLYDVGTDPFLRVTSREHGPVLAAAVPLRSVRWVYGIFVPELNLLATLRQQELRGWLLASFTVLAALALSVIAARWVSTPLYRVTQAAKALAEGDMQRRVGLQQRDEVGQLASAFDAMADALAQKERQLHAYAADLERRVDERTATLQLLERASRTLTASLDLQQTAESLAALLVPELADFCAIDVRERHGALRRIAGRRASSLGSDADPARSHTYELVAGNEWVGRLTIGRAEESRALDDDTERVIEELARRAGLALANAFLYQEAQTANRLKDEFLGVVSHELRTPLNAIMGWARLAAMGESSGVDREKAIDAVERNARALARLVDDLLDVPRIMTGKLALEKRPVDVVAILSSALDAIRPAAQGKAIALVFESTLASATVDADPHRLQQVFWNVLSNAIKFTPAGGRIDVRVAHAPGQVVVVVRDTGIGIAKEFLPHVFDRFSQADSSPSRSHGGLGIGLSLVRYLVEMHDGQVTAASDGRDRGSTFTITLPASPVPLTPLDLPRDTEAERLASLRNLQVLVLDDDADSRDVAAGLLATLGARVVTVSSAREALELLARREGTFDVVLADIGMPGEDGFAFIAALRQAADERVRGLPAIAVTAYASRSDRDRVLEAGFDAHVSKPISEWALGAALSRAFALRPRTWRTDLESAPDTAPHIDRAGHGSASDVETG